MARYQIILAYDGTDFLGYQRQAKGRTVQGVLETALSRLGWSDRATLFSGRTDSGVHAMGQVAAFDLEWAHPVEDLGRAINAYLPADVAVRSVRVAAPDFHPRFDAKGRIYRYQIYCEPDRDPLRDRYNWRVWPDLNRDLLQRAAGLLPGIHDFSAFGTPPRPGGSTTREVFSAAWEQRSGGLQFEVSANAFLYHMVRRIVHLQVQVGKDLLALESFTQAVQAAKPQPPGLAPACGLALKEVLYEALD